MKWKSIKFWLWLDVTFPDPQDDGSQGAQEGPQGGQDCGEEIAGLQVCFDVASFHSEFELNSIPSANVSVVMGRRGDDVTTASNIHYYVEELQLQLPAKVWCFARTLDGTVGEELNEWPTEKFKVFDGDITGSSFQRTQDGVSFSFSITHWLARMNYSSCLSKQSHPLNPSQYFFPPTHVFSLEGSGGALLTGDVPLMVGPELAAAFFNANIITTDFWGGTGELNELDVPYLTGLKDWLLLLTKQNRLNSNQIFFAGGGDLSINAGINLEACQALLRFEPNFVGPDSIEQGYVLGVPLAFPISANLNAFIADSVAGEIGREGLEAYSNVTLWDKLAGDFHANYMFSIVPLVDKALVVPFVPGLSSGTVNTLVHRVIRTSQYDSIDIQTYIPRPLRAVAVIMGKNYEAGGGMSGDQAAPYGNIGGYYDRWVESDDNRFREGLVMFKQGPRWLTNIVSPHYYSGKSTGVTANSIRTILSVTFGEAVAAELVRRQVMQNAKPMWDLFAQTLYMHEILKNRQGTLTGPVRFDIAPGSQIRLEVTEDRYVKALKYDIPEGEDCDDIYATWYWASVLRVSTHIDCQSSKAFTSFYLAHVRNENENTDTGTSIDKHPIWQTCRWAGCVMVQDPIFAPLTTKVCDEE